MRYSVSFTHPKPFLNWVWGGSYTFRTAMIKGQFMDAGAILITSSMDLHQLVHVTVMHKVNVFLGYYTFTTGCSHPHPCQIYLQQQAVLYLSKYTVLSGHAGFHPPVNLIIFIWKKKKNILEYYINTSQTNKLISFCINICFLDRRFTYEADALRRETMIISKPETPPVVSVFIRQWLCLILCSLLC